MDLSFCLNSLSCRVEKTQFCVATLRWIRDGLERPNDERITLQLWHAMTTRQSPPFKLKMRLQTENADLKDFPRERERCLKEEGEKMKGRGFYTIEQAREKRRETIFRFLKTFLSLKLFDQEFCFARIFKRSHYLVVYILNVSTAEFWILKSQCIFLPPQTGLKVTWNHKLKPKKASSKWELTQRPNAAGLTSHQFAQSFLSHKIRARLRQLKFSSLQIRETWKIIVKLDTPLVQD